MSKYTIGGGELKLKPRILVLGVIAKINAMIEAGWKVLNLLLLLLMLKI